MKKSLSHFQQQKLRTQKVDTKFKFGPSGPYRCERTLIFPIFDGEKDIFAEIAVVNADIPMLLGKNILKPLGAQIKLFETGNGALKLKDVEIELKESRGGHYTLKVSDLAKLCGEASNSQNVMFGVNTKTFQCEVCRNIFDSLDDLKTHKRKFYLHGR